MPTFVDPNACNTCEGEEQGPLCVHICPNDLMKLKGHKGFNQEPNMCSECYACVKLCPTEAIRVRGYADFIPLGAEVQPTYVDGNIQWNITFRDGRTDQFTFPVRTTAEALAEFRAINEWGQGANMPRIPDDLIEGIINDRPLSLLGIDPAGD